MTAVSVPRVRFISSVSQGITTTVTMTDDHDFSLGENVSFRVGPGNKMVELNNKIGTVIELTSDSITVTIDSSTWTPFMFGLGVQYLPCVVPSSSGVIPGLYPSTVNLQDNFDRVNI